MITSHLRCRAFLRSATAATAISAMPGAGTAFFIGDGVQQ